MWSSWKWCPPRLFWFPSSYVKLFQYWKKTCHTYESYDVFVYFLLQFNWCLKFAKLQGTSRGGAPSMSSWLGENLGGSMKQFWLVIDDPIAWLILFQRGLKPLARLAAHDMWWKASQRNSCKLSNRGVAVSKIRLHVEKGFGTWIRKQKQTD